MMERSHSSEKVTGIANSTYWNNFHIEFCDWPHDGFTFIARHDETLAGRAHVTIDGNFATLSDIVVVELTVRRWHWLPFCKKHISFRGRGLGSQLLRMVIEQARVRGAKELTGKMVGDLGKLTRWYQRHGFVVVEEAIKVSL